MQIGGFINEKFGVSNENGGGLLWKSVFSDKKIGVSDENLGLSDETVMGVSDEMRSPIVLLWWWLLPRLQLTQKYGYILSLFYLVIFNDGLSINLFKLFVFNNSLTG